MELAMTTGWSEGAAVAPGAGDDAADETVEDLPHADELAFQSFVQRHLRFVFRVAYALLRNRYDADDVVQETFLRLYRKRAWRGLNDERAYLARVAWRLCRDRQRRLVREEGGMEMDTMTATNHSPETAAVSSIAVERIHRMIDSLPEELRQPLVLSTLEEMTSMQIGIALGIPEGTVRTRIQRARALLKYKLALFRSNVMQSKDEFDKLLDQALDRALASYAAQEPDAGLSARISAKVADPAPRPWRAWVLGSATACAAAALLVFLLMHPAARTPGLPSANHASVAGSVPPATTPPAMMEVTRQRLPAIRHVRHALHQPHKAAPLGAQRPAVFPTPSPLSLEEQALVAFVAQHPEKASAVLAPPAARPVETAPLTIAPIRIAALSDAEQTAPGKQ